MYEIKAKLIANRINISRGGARARRLPSIVLATGDVLRIAPGRSVKVTEQVYQANKALIDSFADMIDVIDHREITQPAQVPPEPVVDDNPDCLEIELEPETEPETITVPELETIQAHEPEPETEPETEPEPGPAEEEKPKNKRASRSRRKKADDA